MERAIRKKSIASGRQHGPSSKRKRGGSSSNPGGDEEERTVRAFPKLINFRHEEQRKKFEQLMSRQIVPNRYMSVSPLRSVGLLDEVNTYVSRLGWEAFVRMQHPTYARPTCEFLSSLHFDEHTLMLEFRLGNETHHLGIFELNDIFHFPKNENAHVEFDRNEFWREITGQRRIVYEARAAKESKILSPALKYMHRLISHSVFSRKEGDSVVSTTELALLYCMMHNRKLDICHALANKFRDVATKMTGAIKIGGMVTAIASFLGFDIENMPFTEVRGRTAIDINMMEAIGLITTDFRGIPHLIRPTEPPQEEENQDQNVNLDEVVQRLDDLQLQVGVIDSNVDDLATYARRLDDSMIGMNRRMDVINHNLMAFFEAQKFVPPPFSPQDQDHEGDSSSEEERDE